MNRSLKFMFIVALITGWGQFTQAGMKNSKHDFSKEPWSEGRICDICHTKTFFNLDPNEDLGSGAQGDVRETVTLLCLQCHSDHLPGVPMVTHPPTLTNGNKNLIRFKSFEKDGGLGSSIIIGINDQSQNDYRRCAQCHDVHKTENKHLLIDNYGVKNEN